MKYRAKKDIRTVANGVIPAGTLLEHDAERKLSPAMGPALALKTAGGIKLVLPKGMLEHYLEPVRRY